MYTYTYVEIITDLSSAQRVKSPVSIAVTSVGIIISALPEHSVQVLQETCPVTNPRKLIMLTHEKISARFAVVMYLCIIFLIRVCVDVVLCQFFCLVVQGKIKYIL